jgi:hypothetical protein
VDTCIIVSSAVIAANHGDHKSDTEGLHALEMLLKPWFLDELPFYRPSFGLVVGHLACRNRKPRADVLYIFIYLLFSTFSRKKTIFQTVGAYISYIINHTPAMRFYRKKEAKDAIEFFGLFI